MSAQNDAAQHTDCESCVENGWGWSWSKGECGGYLNTNCDPDSADALDEDEDEVSDDDRGSSWLAGGSAAVPERLLTVCSSVRVYVCLHDARIV